MVPPLRMAMRLTPCARGDPVACAVPGDARAQLGELVGGVAAGEHVEHAVEGVAAEPAKGAAPRTRRKSGVVADAGTFVFFGCRRLLCDVSAS